MVGFSEPQKGTLPGGTVLSLLSWAASERVEGRADAVKLGRLRRNLCGRTVARQSGCGRATWGHRIVEGSLGRDRGRDRVRSRLLRAGRGALRHDLKKVLIEPTGVVILGRIKHTACRTSLILPLGGYDGSMRGWGHRDTG